jgi:hypothetical protein
VNRPVGDRAYSVVHTLLGLVGVTRVPGLARWRVICCNEEEGSAAQIIQITKKRGTKGREFNAHVRAGQCEGAGKENGMFSLNN